MTKFENAVDRYNQKIEALQDNASLLSDETLSELAELPTMPFDDPSVFEDYIYEVTHELAANDDSKEPRSESFELAGDLSHALYLLDQIRDAAEAEIEEREG